MRTRLATLLSLSATLTLALTVALAGCASEPAPGDADAPTQLGKADSAGAAEASLSFNADWTITQLGTLTAGGRVRVHYDVARLPRCRTWYRGYPAWDIVLSARSDAASAPLTETAVTTLTPERERIGTDVILTVPSARQLELWFHASDEGGCSEWDSDYGRNFRFAIAQPLPTLRFAADWSTSGAAELRAGQDFLLSYDVARLGQCRAGYNGYQTWNVNARYRFDGGPVSEASLTETVGMYGRQAAPARIAAPPGARHLEVWFVNSDRGGCVAYDSAYGANYHFDLR